MCMSCGNDSQNNDGGRRFSKKRIAILSTIGAGAAGTAYLSVTINPAIGASIPAILVFATCPAMCAAMGGTMWLSRRLSKKKDNEQQLQQKQKTKEVSDVESITEEQQEKLAIAVTETNDERTVSFEQPQGQRKKSKTNQEGQES
jgi:phosphate/sulfate permease